MDPVQLQMAVCFGGKFTRSRKHRKCLCANFPIFFTKLRGLYTDENFNVKIYCCRRAEWKNFNSESPQNCLNVACASADDLTMWKKLCTAVDDATSDHCGFDFHPALSDCTIEMSSQWERITTLCVTGVNFSPSTVHPTKLMIPHFFFVPGTLLPVTRLIQFIFVSWGGWCWATTRGSLIWCPFMIVLIKFFHFFLWCLDWLAVWCARVMHGITRRMSTYNTFIFYIPFAQKICSHIARSEFNSISRTRIYDCEFFYDFYAVALRFTPFDSFVFFSEF